MTWPEGWNGYLPPTSSTTYTPNQFFDVVLPHSSRGVVRLVAYLIRKTLGWSDAQGRPQEPLVKVSYRELERKAGIAQSKLRQALQEAVDARFLSCVQEGRPDTVGVPAASALYELVWDERDAYITDPTQFQGFFAGNGNLTYIPNQFFDDAIPNETLAVIKVVGTIIRQTIGWQTKFGFRRQEVAISYSELQRRTGLVSRRSLNEALHLALEHNHLVRIESGVFNADAKQQRAATYGIKWAEKLVDAEEIENRFQKDTSQPHPKRYQERTQKDTRTASKRIPTNRTQKDTSIKITPIEITSQITKKQQQANTPSEPLLSTAAALVEELVSQELNRSDALRLAAEKPEECRRQLAYLPYKTGEFRSSKGAYLRRAIEEGFAPPQAYKTVQAQAAQAEQKARQKQFQEAQVAEKTRLWPLYLQYLWDVEASLAQQHAVAYAELQTNLAAEVQKISSRNSNPDSPLRRNWLQSLESGTGRIEHLEKTCKKYHIAVYSFEQWNATQIGHSSALDAQVV